MTNGPDHIISWKYLESLPYAIKLYKLIFNIFIHKLVTRDFNVPTDFISSMFIHLLYQAAKSQAQQQLKEKGYTSQ